MSDSVRDRLRRRSLTVESTEFAEGLVQALSSRGGRAALAKSLGRQPTQEPLRELLGDILASSLRLRRRDAPLSPADLDDPKALKAWLSGRSWEATEYELITQVAALHAIRAGSAGSAVYRAMLLLQVPDAMPFAEGSPHPMLTSEVTQSVLPAPSMPAPSVSTQLDPLASEPIVRPFEQDAPVATLVGRFEQLSIDEAHLPPNDRARRQHLWKAKDDICLALNTLLRPRVLELDLQPEVLDDVRSDLSDSELRDAVDRILARVAREFAQRQRRRSERVGKLRTSLALLALPVPSNFDHLTDSELTSLEAACDDEALIRRALAELRTGKAPTATLAVDGPSLDRAFRCAERSVDPLRERLLLEIASHRPSQRESAIRHAFDVVAPTPESIEILLQQLRESSNGLAPLWARLGHGRAPWVAALVQVTAPNLDDHEVNAMFDALCPDPDAWPLFETWVLNGRNPATRIRWAADWLWRAQSTAAGAIGAIYQSKAIRHLCNALQEDGRGREAALITELAGRCVDSKHTHIAHVLTEAISEVLTASGDRYVGLVRMAFADPAWVLESTTSTVLYLDICARAALGDLVEQARYEHHREMEAAVAAHPVLVQRLLDFAGERSQNTSQADDVPALMAARAALEQFRQDLKKPSCYGAWQPAADFQPGFNQRLQELFDEICKGRAGARLARETIALVKPDRWVSEVGNDLHLDVRDTGRAAMRRYIQHQLNRLVDLATFQEDRDADDLSSSLAVQNNEQNLLLAEARNLWALSTRGVRSVYARHGAEQGTTVPAKVEDPVHVSPSPLIGLPIADVVEALAPDPDLWAGASWGAHDADEAALRLLARSVAIAAGRWDALAAIDGALERLDLHLVLDLMDRSPLAKETCQGGLRSAWQARLDAGARKIGAIVQATRLAVAADDLDDTERAWATELAARATGLPVLDDTLQRASLDGADAIDALIRELSDDLDSFLHLTAERRRTVRTQMAAIFRRVADGIAKGHESDSAEARSRVAEVLRALPSIVLTGQVDLLQECERALAAEDLGPVMSRIQEISIRTSPAARPHRSVTTFVRNVRGPWTCRTGAARAALDDVDPRPLDGTQSIQDAIQSIRGTAPTPLDEGLALMGVAHALPSDSVDGRMALAEGFQLYAIDKIETGRFGAAYDVFFESLMVRTSLVRDGHDDVQERGRAIAGMLLSAWFPKVQDEDRQGELRSRARDLVRDPTLVLRLMRSESLVGPIETVWSTLADAEVEGALLDIVSEHPDVASWLGIFARASLKPSFVFRNPAAAARQLTGIARAAGCQIADDVVHGLENALEPLASGNAVHTRRLESVSEAFKALWRSGSVAPELLEVVSAAQSALIESATARMSKATETLVSVRAVPTMLFISDNRRVSLDLGLQVSRESLPVDALAVELACVDETRNLIRIRRPSRVEVGMAEPDSYHEARFILEFDASLQESSHSTLEFQVNLYDGTRPLIPSDQKRRFSLNLRRDARHGHSNPYVTGTGLDPNSDVFVGRETDQRAILDALIGSSQDNLPLIVGARRIGKTSLIKHILNLPEIRSAYVTVFWDLEQLGGTTTTEDFLVELCERTRHRVQEVLKVDLPFDRQALRANPSYGFERFFSQIDSLRGERRVLLVFDEFEKLVALLGESAAKARDLGRPVGPSEALVDVLPILRWAVHHVRRFSMIICGTPRIRTVFQGEGQRFYGNMVPITLGRFTVDDATKLVQKGGKWFDVSPRAQLELLQLTGLQPYLLQLTLHRLYATLVASGRDVASVTDVREVVEKHLVPESQCFTDFLVTARDAVNDDAIVLRALATARERAGGTLFVDEDSVRMALWRLGSPMTPERLEATLERLSAPDTGLVERQKNRKNRWRLTIGMLGSFLLRGGM